MKTTTIAPFSPAHRQKLKDMLDELKEKVVSAYDRGEKVSVHLHQEKTAFGDPDLLFDMIYQGWTFGLSVGDYPKEMGLHSAAERQAKINESKKASILKKKVENQNKETGDEPDDRAGVEELDLEDAVTVG
jgi:hypothetical protein